MVLSRIDAIHANALSPPAKDASATTPQVAAQGRLNEYRRGCRAIFCFPIHHAVDIRPGSRESFILTERRNRTFRSEWAAFTDTPGQSVFWSCGKTIDRLLRVGADCAAASRCF